MSELRPTYDFIIVGAGPAGCCVARTLANCATRPSVLLLEAGGDNSDANLRIVGNQFVQHLHPQQNIPHQSTPQENLAGRRIDLPRGKGLGGTSAVNFTAWTINPRDDMETMAKLTADPAWSWQNALRRWKDLERCHDDASELPAGKQKYLAPQPEFHGYEGPLHVGYHTKWDPFVTEMLDIWEGAGTKLNTDINTGDLLGFSIMPSTMHHGARITAADLLSGCPDNLTVLTDAAVHGVLFEEKTAVGVHLIDGRRFNAKNEVILSAGALDTPKILMLSGVGPSDQLAQFGIPQIAESPHVGQNSKDHYHIAMKYARAEGNDGIAAFFRDKSRQAQAMREWQTSRTGDYVTTGTTIPMGFFKSEAVLRSQEFALLPKEEQERLLLPTIPTYEIVVLGILPDYYISPATTPPTLGVLLFIQNTQSKGSARLISSDPRAPLDFNTGYMEHPYDKRVIIEATKEVLKVTNSPAFTKGEHAVNPKIDVPGESDEEIIDFWRRKCTSTMHTGGTTQMGRTKEDGVVDPQFRVFGVNKLLVVDLGIMPIISSCHTQSTVYQLGMIAAEKLVEEYSLNGQQPI